MNGGLKTIARILIVVAIAAAIYLVYRSLSRFSLDEVLQAIATIPLSNTLLALVFVAGSYLCLTGFDYFGLRYAGKPLAYRRAALASFVSLSIGHNVGIAAMSSGAVRYRYYSRWGLSVEEVAKVILFSGLTVGLGLSTLAGAGLILFPGDAEALIGIGAGWTLAIGLACLTVPLAYLAGAHFVSASVSIRKWSFRFPSLRLAAIQILLGTTNFALVAACLHQLLSGIDPTPYLQVVTVYAIANSAALVSHVPGGVGVLEAAVVYLIPGAGSLAAMIMFRVLYFFVPLGLGLPILLGSEYLLRPGSGEEAAATADRA